MGFSIILLCQSLVQHWYPTWNVGFRSILLCQSLVQHCYIRHNIDNIGTPHIGTPHEMWVSRLSCYVTRQYNIVISGIISIATPNPFFRPGNQSPFDRIIMTIINLFPNWFGTSAIMIITATLPEYKIDDLIPGNCQSLYQSRIQINQYLMNSCRWMYFKFACHRTL